MKIAFVVYNNMTLLDFVGVYDPLTRLKSLGFLPDLSWDICALGDKIHDNSGLVLSATKVMPDLSKYDLVVVTGGPGSRKMLDNKKFMKWLKSAENSPKIASVCTGALLLGAAGFLQGLIATTRLDAASELVPYCALVSDARVVDAGKVVTARGCSASLDLGLFLCEQIAGKKARSKIEEKMDYFRRPSI